MFNLKSKKEVALEFASKQTFCPKMTESGRSMIEMLGVLAIVGVLSVGGIAGYTKAMLHYKVNKTIEQITHMAAAIKTSYMNQGEITYYDEELDEYYTDGKYYGLDSATAIAIGVAPDEIVEGNSLKNVFGGRVDINGWCFDSSGVNGAGFSIRYDGIPKEACVALTTRNWTGIFQGIIFGNYGRVYGPNEGLILQEYCSGPEWYNQEGENKGFVSCNGEAVTFSPADAALGCTCENNLCSIAF